MTPEEIHDERNRELHLKVANHEDLSPEDEMFFCGCLPLDKLLHHSFCIDTFFLKFFALNRGKIPPPPEIQTQFNFSDRHFIYYSNLVNEWEALINTTQHLDHLLHVIATETRHELNFIRKEFSSLMSNITTAGYQERKFTILEWSKYKFLKCKEIFILHIKNEFYQLHLNGTKIIFDHFSLAHILTRHFAQGMKPYFSSKSHFTADIPFDQIHLSLEYLFSLIDISGLYVNDSIENINLRYKNIIYKIYINSQAGGPTKFFRLKTFFPLINEKMLLTLKMDYTEEVINSDLSVFIKRRPTLN